MGKRLRLWLFHKVRHSAFKKIRALAKVETIDGDHYVFYIGSHPIYKEYFNWN